MRALPHDGHCAGVWLRAAPGDSDPLVRRTPPLPCPACLPAVTCLALHRRLCFLLAAQRGGRVHGASLPVGAGAVGAAGTGDSGAGDLVGGVLPPLLCPLGPFLVPPDTRCSRGRGLTPWAEGRLPLHHGRSRGAPLEAPTA